MKAKVGGDAFLAAEAAACCSVLRISSATVIGPTPPGTGVRKPATWRASSKWTSPRSRRRLTPASSVSSTLIPLQLREREFFNDQMIKAMIKVNHLPVDDDGARLYPVATDHFPLTNGHQEDVGLAANFSQIFGP
jgi:hypothetical protein